MSSHSYGCYLDTGFILLILGDLIVILHLVDVSSQCKIYQVLQGHMLNLLASTCLLSQLVLSFIKANMF